MTCRIVAASLLLGIVCIAAAQNVPGITEQQRQIPVAASVDVVIVGGGSGAVSAAQAAAKNGAKVYLVAPRAYLGEDTAGTFRLWLEEGEKPTTELAQRLFSTDGKSAPIDRNSLPFTYEADQVSAGRHKDTTPPSKLCDGVFGNAAADSVEYGADVTITANLGAPKDVKTARMVIYHRAGDFAAASIDVETSADQKAWKKSGTIKVEPAGDEVLSVSTPIDEKTQYVRFTVKRAEGVKRLLIGEIMLVSPTEVKPPVATTEEKKGLTGPFRPMHIKKSLDEELLACGVQYMYWSHVTDVLRDPQGNISGVVMSNRNGRQAILAKVVIDATDRAWTARTAGASFSQFPAGTQEFKFVTVGGKPKTGDSITSRATGLSYPVAAGPKPGVKKDPKNPPPPVTSAELIEHTIKVPMTDGSYASYAKAEQVIRDLTWDESIQFLTDEIFQVPPDQMKGANSVKGEWAGADKVDLGAFKPAGMERLYVLGGCADVSRDAAAKLVRPVNLVEVGQRLGAAAAQEAKAIPAPVNAVVSAPVADAKGAASVKELLAGLRPGAPIEKTVVSPSRSLPILGEYDVVVVGGGTGGAPAGISAGRAKAKTLVLEYLHGLGGVGTAGMIATYYHGYRGGFNNELPAGASWDPIQREEWWRATNRSSNTDLWFGCVGTGAVVENGRVKGVIVTTPQGRGIVLSKVVIDATGNSDIAAAAGAQTVYHEPSEPAVQGTGLPPLTLGRHYINTDFTLVDDTDMMDIWHVLAYSKRKYGNAFDQGQLIDSRERRRIVGEFTMTLPDAVNLRTYPDTVHIAASDFDTHGFTVDPYLLIEHPQKRRIQVNVPLRCLLPKGLEGILVIGLGVSAHRDVMPLLRMQPDIQNQGYAAGLIAATAAQKNQAIRELDLKPIQQQLMEKEIIPGLALSAKDSYPLPAEKIAEAVASVKDKGKGMSVIITHLNEAMPLLKQAFAAAQGEDKLAYAKVLAVLGDPAGADILIEALEAKEWDKGWNYTGMGQFGHALSEVDSLIVALGRARSQKALPAILKKVSQLDKDAAFSHHRAVSLALEMIGDKSAAGPLAALLAKPDMTGYTVTTVEQAAARSGGNTNDNSTRATALRELSLARALYRCGDQDGLGKKILEQYTQDLRGHMAQHARAVLAAK